MYIQSHPDALVATPDNFLKFSSPFFPYVIIIDQKAESEVRPDSFRAFQEVDSTFLASSILRRSFFTYDRPLYTKVGPKPRKDT
jgi:hypothetical protein